jgi:hypothetical protein
MDQATEAIRDEAPWLKTETADDLVQLLERATSRAPPAS